MLYSKSNLYKFNKLLSSESFKVYESTSLKYSTGSDKQGGKKQSLALTVPRIWEPSTIKRSKGYSKQLDSKTSSSNHLLYKSNYSHKPPFQAHDTTTTTSAPIKKRLHQQELLRKRYSEQVKDVDHNRTFVWNEMDELANELYQLAQAHIISNSSTTTDSKIQTDSKASLLNIEEELEEQEQPLPPPRSILMDLNPKKIRAYLDDYVIGQDDLKKTLAVAIYNHYLRIESNLGSESASGRGSFAGKPSRKKSVLERLKETQDTIIDKSNVMLIGPTGSGKTLIAKTTAKLLDVAFSMSDATPFTQAGYVGEDVEMVIHRLLQNADFDVARAQRGIVFIDEIDKISRKTDPTSPNQRDVSGEGVQQGLLRMLEGTVVNITLKPGQMPASMAKRGTQSSEVFSVDTSNILFICSGAFIGLENIVGERMGKKSSIGFDAPLQAKETKSSTKNPLEHLEPEDLIKYGFIPEFIGRIPVLATATQLNENELARVLSEPKNSLIKQYETLFARAGIQLRFHQQSILKIAEIASTKKTGARGLRRIMENTLQEALYEYPGTEYKYLIVLPDSVMEKQPLVAFKEMEYDAALDCLSTGIRPRPSSMLL